MVGFCPHPGTLSGVQVVFIKGPITFFSSGDQLNLQRRGKWGIMSHLHTDNLQNAVHIFVLHFAALAIVTVINYQKNGQMVCSS